MKKVIGYISILVGMPVVGVLLLLAVHFLPTAAMREHVYDSKELLMKEFADEEVIDGYPATLTGSFTDCLMLEHAVYDGSHSAFMQSMRMYRSESYYDGVDESIWHPGESLIDYLEGKEAEREVEYSRYWHGYLVVLKPLLLITSVGSIRMLNASVQLLLVGICLILMERRRHTELALGFLGSIPFLFFLSSFSSLSQSVCLYLLLLELVVMLCLDNRLEQKKWYLFFFLISGMLTAYFDFLTYPLVTLGYPLVVYFSLHSRKGRDMWKRLICFSWNWGIGYLFMWSAKWILSDLLTGSNTIADAFSTILARTGIAGGQNSAGGFLQIVRLNIGAYLNFGFLLFVLVLGVMELLFLVRKKGKLCLNNALPYLLIACAPFVWWMAAANHSEEHWMYTCRIFAISVFSILTGVGSLRKRPGE